jgi:hypothetical protein
MTKTLHNGVIRDMTAEEQTAFDNERASETAKISQYKLDKIRNLRNQKLYETDYLAMSDNTMSDEIKTYRQSMRNIPQDYSADKYDELLARDSDGKLTHTVWEKP